MSGLERVGEPEDLYGRLSSGDPTASAEFAEKWMSPLFQRLRQAYPGVDEELIADAVTDAILALIQRPSSYDPRRGRLDSYLFMSARGDLLNALNSRNRQQTREVLTDPVELLFGERNNQVEGSITDHAGEATLEELLVALCNPVDRQVLELMLDGERRTAVYAEVLGVSDHTIAEQRVIVKRHKDRIKKRLRRLRHERRRRKNP